MRSLVRNRWVWLAVILVGACTAFAVGRWRRARPLTIEACSAQAQGVALGCGSECSAQFARGNSSHSAADYAACTDRCAKRLTDIVKGCGP